MTARKPVTLITGASAGIGAALAREFAARDHKLVLVARRVAQLDAVADAIAASGKLRPQVVALDLGQPEPGIRMERALAERDIEPEIVVNNAGFGLLGPAEDLDLDAQLAMIDLNVRTLTEFSLRWTDSLVRHRGGILNVASIAAHMPGPYLAVYHATKAYVLSFSEALRVELAPRGVRVTTLCPGPVATEFQARAHVPESYFPRLLTRSENDVARDGYNGLMRGRRTVTPGLPNKLVGLATYSLFRPFLAAGQARRYRSHLVRDSAKSDQSTSNG